MADWYLQPRMLAKSEIEQARSLGHDCAELIRRLEALPEKDLSAEQDAEARRIYEAALALGAPKDSPYVEPSDLEGIRRLRPRRPRRLGCGLSEDMLLERIHGGWLGRAAGCLAGKPVEGWSRAKIAETLRKLNAYPLDGYFPRVPVDEGAGFHGRPKEWTRGHITRAPRDDDTDYTILGLHVLESFGPGFSTENMGAAWLANLPFLKTYTAERAAYRNLVNGLTAPGTATVDNPYREWIGAQIRADAFGYVSPALPEVAAELAHRDARLSHVANGIYGEMWVAAMLAGAFVSDDAEEVIEIGLGEIPRASRLAEAVGKTVQWCKRQGDWEKVCDRILAEYGSLHSVHTINNACLVALGLMKAEGDFTRGVCISVMGGWDTDCNGATTGSVLGVMMGAGGIPQAWAEPLHDMLDSALFGYATNSIAALARRTLEVSRKVRAAFPA